MARLTIPTRDQSPAASQPILDAIGKQFGVIPNVFRLIGLSPAALEGFAALNAAIGKTLDVKTRGRIAIAVAQANGCDYCLSAHTYLGANLLKLDAAELALNRNGHSGDARSDAAVSFAQKVAASRGRIADADIAAVRAAGYTEAQILEIVANVTLNVMTNFANNIAQTDIDFPVVHTAVAA